MLEEGGGRVCSIHPGECRAERAVLCVISLLRRHSCGLTGRQMSIIRKIASIVYSSMTIPMFKCASSTSVHTVLTNQHHPCIKLLA